MIKKLSLYLILAVAPLTSAKGASILSLSSQFTDSTVVMPQSMETDVHKMLENWYLQNYVVLDRTADNGADKEVSDEVIIARLAAMPTKIEMPYNSIVRSYIDMYTQKRRQLIENMLGMSLYYMPIFEEALERNNVPLELKYLPIIESALNPDAVSRAGATGLWQFMLPTARGLGLEINSLVDERRDPYKSSEQAARYLRQLYDIFNDWSLAIAAYNCGPGNVGKALKRAGDGDGKKRDFWDIYYYLPAETRGYFPCFIAANYVMTYYPEHNISPALARRPLITDSIHVNHGVHLQQIADVLNLPLEEIKVLNPQYREDYIPGEFHPYSLVLPSKQIYSYLASEDSILSHDKERYARRLTWDPSTGEVQQVRDDGDYIVTEKTQWHKVKRGETLTTIAKRYGMKVSELKKINGGISSVKRGQTIKIVTLQREKKPQEAIQSQINEQQDSVTNGSGDDFARRELIEAGVIEDGNGTTEETVVEETVEPAPAPKPAPKPAVKKQPASTPTTITVKKGDTLSSISRTYKVSVARLKELNGLKSDAIRAGQKLKIK